MAAATTTSNGASNIKNAIVWCHKDTTKKYLANCVDKQRASHQQNATRSKGPLLDELDFVSGADTIAACSFATDHVRDLVTGSSHPLSGPFSHALSFYPRFVCGNRRRKRPPAV
jgi:hypothetical protein